MTLNTMLYYHVHEGIEIMSLNDFRDDNDPLKQQVNPIPTPEEVLDPCYIRWQMFDEIPGRLYTIECEGYVDKNGNPLTDEESIRHLISGEPKLCVNDVIERYDENGIFLGYDDFDDSPCYYLDRNKYDFRKITKQIRTKKVICEAPIRSG